MKQQLELSLGGKKRKFTFGILFLGSVLERDEFEDYNDLLIKTSKNPFKYAPILMYESLVNTANKYNKKVDITQEKIIEYLDKDFEDGVNKMLSFINVFMGNSENKAPIKSDKESTTKKK